MSQKGTIFSSENILTLVVISAKSVHWQMLTGIVCSRYFIIRNGADWSEIWYLNWTIRRTILKTSVFHVKAQTSYEKFQGCLIACITICLWKEGLQCFESGMSISWYFGPIFVKDSFFFSPEAMPSIFNLLLTNKEIFIYKLPTSTVLNSTTFSYKTSVFFSVWSFFSFCWTATYSSMGSILVALCHRKGFWLQ